jgi:2-polyprenyl-6-methoxyphenol hydroxylase-like FAD-dependent oxidoreductase
MSLPKIAIIGAGPAGSTLGRLLHLANIPCTIFEGEASANVRTQGGTLDLHHDTGLAALKECQLYDAFLKIARYDGEALIVCDKDFRRFISTKGKTSETKWGRPEIDRERLREILLQSLPDGMVKWNHRLRSVHEENGEFVLNFDHGSERGYDLIVGAEGTWSKVRPLLTNIQPEYSGIGGFWGPIPNAAKEYPELSKLVNQGSLFSFSNGKSIIAQQLGTGSLHVFVAWVRPEEWSQDHAIDIQSLTTINRILSEEYGEWDDRLVNFVRAMNLDNIVSRNLYMLPVGIRWKNRPGVTLIGDAAHVMTPYAGEGVNMAMADSMNLAHAIIAASNQGENTTTGSLTNEVKKFEEKMFVRATKYQSMTFSMMSSMFFESGAPYDTIEKYVITALAHDLPWGVRPFAVVAVHIFYWVYKRFFLEKRNTPKLS